MHVAYLECDLRGEDEFVSLKQSTSGVHVDGVCDAVDEVFDSLLHFIGWFSSLYSFMENNTERLEGQKTQTR